MDGAVSAGLTASSGMRAIRYVESKERACKTSILNLSEDCQACKVEGAGPCKEMFRRRKRK